MKEKKTLSEAQVKRFMKLAGNHVLSETFVNNLSQEDEQLEELEKENEGQLYKDDEELEVPLEGPPEDLAPEDEVPDMDMAPEGEEVVDSGPMSKVRDIVADAVMDALSGAVETGELDISEEEPVGEPLEGEPGDELAPEAPPEEELPLEEVSEFDDLEESDVHCLDEEEITNEVLKRVAARLVRESKKEKLIDQLAQRLSKRLK